MEFKDVPTIGFTGKFRVNLRIREKISSYVVNIHIMTKEIEVIYEHGVFKPQETVDYPESVKMRIRIDNGYQRCERHIYRKRGV